MARQQSGRVTLLDVYLGVICLFPITTMLADDNVVNKIMFVLLLALHLGMLAFYPLKKSTLLLLGIMVVHYVFVLINTEFPISNINMLAYYPFFLLYTYFVKDNGSVFVRWFKSNQKYVMVVLNVWSFLVGISVFIPGCYYVKEGGARYFGSFCNSIFRLGPSALFVQFLGIVAQIFYKQKRAVVYGVLPMYCYLMGSSRTYLVIGCCLFAVSWYVFCKKKSVFWGTFIPMVLAMLMLVSVSSMAEKIKFTLDESQYGDFWFRITSGRSVIWENIFVGWSATSIWKRFLGNGLGFTYVVAGHWAHNDYIEILCSTGIFGLWQYLNAMHLLYKGTYRNVRLPFFIKMCLFLVWACNAMMNMHYTYFCAVLCYPLLLQVMRCYFAENQFLQKRAENTLEC